jgi:hypothetical protein
LPPPRELLQPATFFPGSTCALTASAINDLTLDTDHVAIRSESPDPDARDVDARATKPGERMWSPH